MRILIAAHQPKMRFALRVALEQRPGFKAIGEAIDAQDLLAQARVICPDLVLIDWELPEMSIAELTATLHHTCANLRVIILNSREETREQALVAGADAFVWMCNAPDELLYAIDRCLSVNKPSEEQKEDPCSSTNPKHTPIQPETC